MRKFLAAVFIILAVSGCAQKETEKYETSIFAMDTIMTFTVYGKNAEAAVKSAVNKIYLLDEMLSTEKESSEISKINNAEGEWTEVSEEVAKQIVEALAISGKSGGALDISVYPAVKAWGFTTKEYRVLDEKERSELVSLINYKKIETDGNKIRIPKDMSLDLGAVAKGFTSEEITKILKSCGAEGGVVSLGGNVQVFGDKPDGSEFLIAVQDPSDENGYAGLLKIKDKAVVTSGVYQRNFSENGILYHHIIDPKTAAPAESGLLSVTVVCESGTQADGLSTALFVMGLDEGLKLWREEKSFDALFITEDKKIYITEGLSECFAESETASGYTYETVYFSEAGRN